MTALDLMRLNIATIPNQYIQEFVRTVITRGYTSGLFGDLEKYPIYRKPEIDIEAERKENLALVREVSVFLFNRGLTI